jgi:hypothetical protein
MAYSGLCTVADAGVKLKEGLEWRATVGLKAPAFPNGRNFYTAPNMMREVLAVGLAAITSYKQVWCDIPDEGTEWSELSRITLISNI